MGPVNRREFLKSTLSTAALAAMLPTRPSRAANERVRIGLMGCGGRGSQVAQMFAGRSDAEISTVLARLWRARADRYSELRTSQTDGLPRGAGKVEMSYIGG